MRAGVLHERKRMERNGRQMRQTCLSVVVLAGPEQVGVALHSRVRQRPVVATFPVSIRVLSRAVPVQLGYGPQRLRRDEVEPGELGAFLAPCRRRDANLGGEDDRWQVVHIAAVRAVVTTLVMDLAEDARHTLAVVAVRTLSDLPWALAQDDAAIAVHDAGRLDVRIVRDASIARTCLANPCGSSRWGWRRGRQGNRDHRVALA